MFKKVKARERNCEISGYLQMKDKRWRKQWLEVAEFALYVFEKHEVLFKCCLINLVYQMNLFVFRMCRLKEVSPFQATW